MQRSAAAALRCRLREQSLGLLHHRAVVAPGNAGADRRQQVAGLSALAYVILMGMVFSQWAWFAVLGRLPVAVASIGSLAVPMVGVLSSALLLHEPVGPAEFAALALVVAAFATVLLHPAPPRH